MSAKKSRKRALVYVWTGNGFGKTTSALGIALRQVGHKKKVVMVQFMKGRPYIGELKAAKKFGKLFKIYQVGRRGWVDLKNPSKMDKELAKAGLELAKKQYKEQRPSLLILDELNLACAIGLVDVDDVIGFLNKIKYSTRVYITGRKAPVKLRKRADFVEAVTSIKRPAKRPAATKGIEY